MPLYGAEEILFNRFGGGLVLDVDATEIGEDQAADAQNVDLENETDTRRKGRAAYNSSAPTANPVQGAFRYYPPGGGTEISILQAGTAIYEDPVLGTFSSVLAGLTGGAPMDFLGYKGLVYAGNGVDALRKRSLAGAWSTVANLAAPAIAPGLKLSSTVLETFDGSGWSAATGMTFANVTGSPAPREGTGSLQIALTGSGASGSATTKTWSAGATVDLSAADSVVLWYWADKVGLTFQIGVKDNLGAIDYSLFPTFTSTQKEAWVPIRVPLTGLAPAQRTASTGLGFKFLSKTSKITYPQNIYLDAAYALGPLVDDRYVYSATYAVEVTNPDATTTVTQESNPGAIAALKLASLPIPPLGLVVAVPLTNQSGVTHIRIYRIRDTGPFRKARFVGQVANTGYAGTTLTNVGGISASATSMTVASSAGFSNNDYFFIDSECLQVTNIAGLTWTVTRGQFGTGAAAHAQNAAVTRATTLTDTVSDQTITASDYPELVTGKVDPPLAGTYALVNHRLLCGNVTVGGTSYPYRIYVSRLGFPEEFVNTDQTNQIASDPTVAGYFDLPERDKIVRIVELNGLAVIFCERSVWTLEGSGWDDFAVRKRADVGLDARWATTTLGRLVFFLASDGVRVLLPDQTTPGMFDTWVLSEPVNSRLRAIPATKRKNACMGIDERGRVHLSFTRAGQTVNDAALVFDPRRLSLPGKGSSPGQVDPFRQGALSPNYNPVRPGWTYYLNWGFSGFLSLKRGGNDAGQLIGWDPATAKLHYLQRGSTDTDLTTDDGAAVVWFWQSRALDVGPGAIAELVYATGEFDAAAGQLVTFNAVLNRAVSGTSYNLDINTETLPKVRVAPTQRARVVAIRISGSHSVSINCHSIGFGYYVRH